MKQIVENFFNKKIIRTDSLTGGCINDAYKITLENNEVYFIKYNAKLSVNMFIKEANGLKELKKSNTIKVPEVVFVEKNLIILEYIPTSNSEKNFYKTFGEQFAQLHKYTSDKYGFYEDNFIGSTPQINNQQYLVWSEFYYNERLLYQFRLCEKNGYADSELRNAFKNIEKKYINILEINDSEKPSLLHGDLWSGNYLCFNGKPCLIDPAVYYGNREADLAMTKLFGGFTSDFYSSYNEIYPLLKDYHYRENIYKLYHILNHLNLFGMGYYRQAISLMLSY
ncbi:MAG TPA: fructosamine kinase family protein [Ignavibacteriaceae bacterium]|nr:fructosamine kinase family protein [Ignavibacteriaceae bacterium]